MELTYKQTYKKEQTFIGIENKAKWGFKKYDEKLKDKLD